MERVMSLPDNAMIKVRPDLWDEWDWEKNDNIDIYSVNKGDTAIVWWKCPKCKSNYDNKIYNRVRYNCPCCRGLRVTEANCLATLRPDLVKYWVHEKNDKTPYEVTCGATYVAVWKCDNGHEYPLSVSQRNLGTGCGYCSGKHVWVGYNDMNTTNPELAKLLLNKNDGYKYTEGSKQRVDWCCPTCNDVIKNKVIMIVKNEGLRCPNCSDSKHYPERFMNQLLRQLNVEYDWDKPTKFSGLRRYDFYIPSMSLIIETNGQQHIEGGFEAIGGRSLEEEIENDKLKYELAIQNGIKHYIAIDCRYSKFEYIKNNIIHSELNNLFDLNNVDWDRINLNLNKSLIENIANEWSNGLFNSKQIAKIYKKTIKQTIQILEKATKLGLCAYSKLIDKAFSDKVVLKLDDNLNVIERLHMESDEFKDLNYDVKKINASQSSLGKYLNYYWCKEISLEKFTKRIITKRKQIEDDKRKRESIVQLDLNGQLIRNWKSINEILSIHNDYNKVSIRNCLMRNNFTYKNYIWLYKKFYDTKEGKDYIKDKLSKLNPKLTGSKKRVVLQINPKNGEIINKFESIVKAIDYIGVTPSSVNKCLDRTRKTTGGFMWIREREYETDEGKQYIEDLVKWYKSR